MKVYAVETNWNAESLTASTPLVVGSLLAEASSRADTWVSVPLLDVTPTTVAFAIKESGDSLGSIYSTESTSPPVLMLSSPPNDNDLDSIDDLLDLDDDNDHISDSFESRSNSNPLLVESIFDPVHLNYALALLSFKPEVQH